MSSPNAPCIIGHLYEDICSDSNLSCLVTALQIRYGKLLAVSYKAAELQTQADWFNFCDFQDIRRHFAQRLAGTEYLGFGHDWMTAEGRALMLQMASIVGQLANPEAHVQVLKDIEIIYQNDKGVLRRTLAQLNRLIDEVERNIRHEERWLADKSTSSSETSNPIRGAAPKAAAPTRDSQELPQHEDATAPPSAAPTTNAHDPSQPTGATAPPSAAPPVAAVATSSTNMQNPGDLQTASMPAIQLTLTESEDEVMTAIAVIEQRCPWAAKAMQKIRRGIEKRRSRGPAQPPQAETRPSPDPRPSQAQHHPSQNLHSSQARSHSYQGVQPSQAHPYPYHVVQPPQTQSHDYQGSQHHQAQTDASQGYDPPQGLGYGSQGYPSSQAQGYGSQEYDPAQIQPHTSQGYDLPQAQIYEFRRCNLSQAQALASHYYSPQAQSYSQGINPPQAQPNSQGYNPPQSQTYTSQHYQSPQAQPYSQGYDQPQAQPYSQGYDQTQAQDDTSQGVYPYRSGGRSNHSGPQRADSGATHPDGRIVNPPNPLGRGDDRSGARGGRDGSADGGRRG